VRLDLFLAVTSLLAQLQELFSVFDGAIQLTLSLVNHTNLLVALSFDLLVLELLADIETLLEELERHVKLTHL